jgi:hypothetical protein
MKQKRWCEFKLINSVVTLGECHPGMGKESSEGDSDAETSIQNYRISRNF